MKERDQCPIKQQDDDQHYDDPEYLDDLRRERHPELLKHPHNEIAGTDDQADLYQENYEGFEHFGASRNAISSSFKGSTVGKGKAMTETKQWIVAGFVITLIIVGLVVFYAMTKPTCPPNSSAHWTRQGWYCVVPPVRS